MPEQKKSLKQKVLSGVFWVSSLTFLGQLFTWFVTLFVIRLLRPEDYGLMAMASFFIGFLRLLNEAGLAGSVIQKETISTEEIKNVTGFVLLLNVALTVLIFATSPYVSMFFSEPRLTPVIRVLSINFLLLSLFFMPQTLLRRKLLFRRKASIDFFSNLFSSAVVLLLAFWGLGVWALVWGTIALHLAKALGFNLKKEFCYAPSFSFKGMGPMLSFGGHVSLTRILWYFYSRADIVIAGRLLGKNLLGIYSVALHLATLPMEKISPVFAQIAFPVFSRINSDLDSVKKYFLKLTEVLNILFLPAFLGLIIVAPEIIPLALGERWQVAVVPIQLLCIVMPLRLLGLLFPPIINAVGRPDIMTGNMVFGLIIMPIGFYIGSHWGVKGLCYAWLIGYPILFSFMGIRILALLQLTIRSFLSTFSLPLLASTAMVAGLLVLKYYLALRLSPLILATLLITAGILIYGGTILLLKPNIIREMKSVLTRE